MPFAFLHTFFAIGPLFLPMNPGQELIDCQDERP